MNSQMHTPLPVCGLRVVVLEDDDVLREYYLLPGLRRYGFLTIGLGDAASLMQHLRANVIDILVLDLGLPDMDGHAVAAMVRASLPSVGIVMLTARNDLASRLRGLSEGADCYLTKPIELELLATSLYSVARRILAAPAAVRCWQLDKGAWRLVSPGGATIPLTGTERRLLDRMMQECGQLVKREELISAIAADAFEFSSHRLDGIIYRLRRKTASICKESLPLVSVHAEGFIFYDNLGSEHCVY
jgi:DNA-binding response OmpR family regulator